MSTISSIPFSETIDTTGFEWALGYEHTGACEMGFAWNATWWSWTPATDQVVTITMVSVAGRYCHVYKNDAYLSCYTTEGADLVLAAEAGNTYTFLVTTFYQFDTGTVTFNVDPTPANDRCALAYDMGYLPSNWYNSDTTAHRDDTDQAVSEAICGTGNGYQASWFSWTCEEPYDSISFAFWSDNANGAICTVFSGSCGSLVYLACFYDSTPSPTLAVTPGTTYYFLVTGGDALPFSFIFNVEYTTTYLELCKEIVCPSSSPSPSPSASASPEPSRLIRRMRQSPHLSDEHVHLFFAQFQLDLEVGLGLTEGQGVDPMLMLQWSDDGGQTWGEEHWLSAGRLGRYLCRAIWRRLGRARVRTWRVVVSDPVPVRILDAYVLAQKGTA